jgi:uncharacterized protein (DUF697 family)
MVTRASTVPTQGALEAPKSDVPSDVSKEEAAERIIKHNVLWSVGAGVIPLPILDAAATAAVQIRMLKQLSDLYEVPFREDRIKNICSGLVAGLGSPVLGATVGMSALKFVPVLGPFVALLAMPASSAAFTYAVGKVFVQHFASGGTFLDFDPKTVREYFSKQFEEGKLVVSKGKTESGSTKTESNPTKTD